MNETGSSIIRFPVERRDTTVISLDRARLNQARYLADAMITQGVDAVSAQQHIAAGVVIDLFER